MLVLKACVSITTAFLLSLPAKPESAGILVRLETDSLLLEHRRLDCCLHFAVWLVEVSQFTLCIHLMSQQMLAVLFLSHEILVKCFGCVSRTFLYCSLLQHDHPMFVDYTRRHLYKIYISICCASDTGHGQHNKPDFVALKLTVVVMFPLVQQYTLKGFSCLWIILYKGRKMTMLLIYIFFLC